MRAPRPLATVDVMARVARKHLPDGTYHVVSRATDYNRLFEDDDDRAQFVSQLRKVARRFRWRLHAFCLLGTHVHVVVTCTRVELSAGMKVILERHAMAFNHKHGRRGHLVANRFWCRLVDDEALEATCGYVRLNPVNAGLCERPDDWPWMWSRYPRAERYVESATSA